MMSESKTIESKMNIDGLVVHYGWSPEPEDVEAESDRNEPGPELEVADA